MKSGVFSIEHSQKNCSHSEAAVLLGFGFVFAQSQAAEGHAPSLSLAKTPKSPAAERLQFFFKRSNKTAAAVSLPVNTTFRAKTMSEWP